MIKTELLELISNGENSGVEFKLDTIENHRFAKELVALANLQGGVILLGVEDSGLISGITRENLEEWVMTVGRDKIRPEIVPYFEVIRNVEPNKDVAVVRVERGWTVHHLWHNNHRTYFIRVGSQSREMSSEELERLFQQRGSLRVELRPISGTSIDDLDLRRARDYFTRIRQQDFPDDPSAIKTVLANTEFLVEDNGNVACTFAGLALFGKNPSRFLPHIGIDAVAYPGTEEDYASTERATIQGPLTPLFADKELVENGVIEQAVDFVKRNTGVTAELQGGVRRVEQPAYPVEAVRETIVNAVVHRDYLLSSTSIQLSVFSDRLEVVSPGRLPNSITPDRMRIGCRASRNQLIKDVLRDYGYLEHMGMGIPRKVIKLMRDVNKTEPDLIEQGESFIVRLKRSS